MNMDELVWVVEGKSDKEKLRSLLPENALILCTNGTVDEEALLDLLEPYEMLQFITLFDADKNGHQYRKLMNRIYPEAIQLQIPSKYKEVAETPAHILRDILKRLPQTILDE